MADRYERMLHTMRVDLTVLYAQLALICHRLPIPVELPTQEGVHLLDDMTPAVRRLVEIVRDMPMDEDTQSGVFMASIDWLTAVDLWVLMGINEPDDTREMCFAGAITSAHRGLALLLEEGDAEYNGDIE
ncbi:hypothetical protein ABZ820_34705 [Streptomyces diacarni]|uniref:hypothetical protein n=1 Tax=Streptomyces diacarni TaxID=2800381 RepID=UPI0033CB27E1